MSAPNSAVSATSNTNPPPQDPAIARADKDYQEAGLARNRAEAEYHRVKKEKGGDSAEAEAAQKKLIEAQKNVEEAQKVLKKLLGIKPFSPKKPASAPAPKESIPSPEPPQPQKNQTPEHPPEVTRSEFIRMPIRSEFIARRSSEMLIRRSTVLFEIHKNPEIEKLLKDPKALKKFLEDSKALEKRLKESPNSEMLIQNPLLRALEKTTDNTEASN